MPGLHQKILHHYKNTEYHRSDDQLLQEQHLFLRHDHALIPAIRFHPFHLIPASMLLQFCCGSLYAWSVYNTPIEQYIYASAVVTHASAITFYLAVGSFGLSAALLGPWMERNGPRRAALYGSLGFFIAQLITALGVYVRHMAVVYVGYGLIGGASLGLCYIAPVSPLQKWFPRHRGLTSGLAVCGFGAGSIAAAPLQYTLITHVGVNLTFVILACTYAVVMVGCTVVLRVPPPSSPPSVQAVEASTATLDVQIDVGPSSDGMEMQDSRESLDLKDMKTRPDNDILLTESMRSRTYLCMYMLFMANTVAGLVILSRLSPMVQSLFGVSASTAAWIVSVNGAFNLSGRFLFGLISDTFGRRFCFAFTLILQLCLLSAMTNILHGHQVYAFVGCMWVLTSCYGASFGLIPAFLADRFPLSHVGPLHGLILTAWAIAGVAGGLVFTAVLKAMVPSSYTASDPWPYLVNFYWIMGIQCAGIVALMLVPRKAQ